MLTALIFLAFISIALVIYHHILWPAILIIISNKCTRNDANTYNIIDDQLLPTIRLIIPVHNEEQFIQQKLANCAILDYPSDKLYIHIVCDGCHDDTLEMLCAYLENTSPVCHIYVDIGIKNRGKLSVINQAIHEADESIIVLSDCSALLSIDSLRYMAHHFQDHDIGVVTGSYRFLQQSSHGASPESQYWQYQSRIKQAESVIGSVIGAHGACYGFRRSLYTPPSHDTVNDDFVIPMQIVAQGYRAHYDPSIVALELEEADTTFDFNRRKRLGAGNMQQSMQLKSLLHPRYGTTALSFFSGKVLRAWMPYILMIAFFTSGVSAVWQPWMLLLFLPQYAIYLAAYIGHLGILEGRLFRISHYVTAGYVASLIGSWRYLTNTSTIQWQEA